MPFRLGPWELILVLLIALVVFGPSRIGKLGGELGKSLREFQNGLKGEEETEESALN